MLQVEQLFKRYGACVAVNGISFAIAAGETVGLLGPNGAGKTTVSAMISGIARPDSGLVPQDLSTYFLACCRTRKNFPINEYA